MGTGNKWRRTMNRILAVFAIALAVLASAHPAVIAQQAEKVYRIGFLDTTSPARIEAFRQEMRHLGYVEGRNLEIEFRKYRYSKIKKDRPTDLAALAADLVRQKVDVIVCSGPVSPRAAMSATRTIPIVVAVTGDFVTQGLAASLRRPGGNVTGLTAMGADVIGKQLELFKETVPGLSRVAVLRNPSNRAHLLDVRQAEEAAKALGLRLIIFDLHGSDELHGIFRRLAADGIDGLLILRDSKLIKLRKRLTDLAKEARLPTMFGHSVEAKAGGLISYGTNVNALYRRAASYVDKIFKGANPAEMPIERPTKFDLVVNLKTAKALGITFPPSILLRANKVIE